jgi:DNA repair protein RadD
MGVLGMMGNSLLLSPAKPLKTPRDYQESAFPAVMDWFEGKEGWPLVVIPTGGGKSLIMAEFIRRALEIEPSTRFMIVSHVSELLKQNAEAVIGQCPGISLSFYSDKLGQKDLSGQVIVAGIQSVYKKAHQIQNPPADLILIDEVHTLPHTGEGMYRKFLKDILQINPYMKVCGYTATPFRAKTGLLHKGEGAMFGGIAYEIGILDLIEQGYLCQISTPSMSTRMSTEGVKVQGGDYVQKHLEAAVDKDEITTACVNEIMQYAEGRNKWLVFTAGVGHCEHVRDEIRSRGIACEMVTGNTETGERNRIIAWHKEKSHEPRCLVNVSVLTTGYDNPAIDLIAFMRPTRSPVLYIQMIGRGMRISPGKDDCVILDFGGVIETLGPIDQIRLPTKKKGEGEAPSKACPECGEINHAAARLCIKCGFEFPAPEIKIGHTASEAAVLSTQLRTETYPVSSVNYRRHKKEGKPDTLCIEYSSGMTKSFRKWLCLEHSGTARELAAFWWRKAARTKEPNTITEALTRTHELRKPVSVTVKKVGKYHEIVGVEYAN